MTAVSVEHVKDGYRLGKDEGEALTVLNVLYR